jgi:DNA-binding GntR family transcriptional regulator
MSSIYTIPRTDLGDEVYRVLRQRIFTEELRPGDKVRPEVVARELGVSRTPVVEAINRLAEQGLVVLQPHRGTFVSTLPLERVGALFDVRLMMEEFGARRGLARVTDADVERLRTRSPTISRGTASTGSSTRRASTSPAIRCSPTCTRGSISTS